MKGDGKERPAFEPLKAIGVFLAVFGAAVMAASLMDMPAQDRIINLASGLVILGAGVGALALGIGRSRRGCSGKDSDEGVE